VNGAPEQVVSRVREAIMSESRLRAQHRRVSLALRDGTLTLEGEVDTLASKKLTLERAAGVPDIDGIIDRLHVAPAQPMTDGEIGALMREALLQEPAFSEFRLTGNDGETGDVDRAEAPGSISFQVSDGVITLNGSVPGLDYKRLAGVLAWWIPGSRDVINGIAVEPPEEDSFDSIAEAVRLVLEKDPFVDAAQLRVGVRGRVVTLAGVMPSEPQRHMAEMDAWYVFGVDNVVNNIEVRR